MLTGDDLDGPWEVEHVVDEEGDHIWWVNTPYLGPAAAKCFNPHYAQLIAATPDMYEALKQCEQYLSEMSCTDEDLLSVITDAMAKGRGDKA
jgi:hypothetical protein